MKGLPQDYIPEEVTNKPDVPEKAVPKASNKKKAVPKETEEHKEVPQYVETNKDLPETDDPRNIVTLGEEKIVIKPTKLKYQRDRTAAFYRVLEAYPLPDILAMEAGVLDPERDGDKCLFDWLIAVFDNSRLVTRYYDKMDTAIVEQCLEIFKRLNGITDREEKAKNRETKETKR